MKAWNPVFHDATRSQAEELRKLKWYHSFRFPDGREVAGFQSLAALEHRLAQFDLPLNLRGARVLDIGSWDGWFSFEMERRGASVVALDVAPVDNFRIAHAILESKVEYRIGDITDQDTASLGKFDIVLFFGVLYHLKHPLKAIEKVAALADDIVCIETYVTENEPPFEARPLCEFYETDELCGQFDNWSGPNIACLLAWCRSTGLCDVELRSVIDFRAHVKATKRKRFGGGKTGRAHLTAVHNSITMDQTFRVDSEDYIAAWFTYTGDIAKADLFAEIGDYTVPCIHLLRMEGDSWHSTFKLPFGLNRAVHAIRLRSGAFSKSNGLELFVGMNLAERSAHYFPSTESITLGPVHIAVVTDGKTWARNVVRSGPGACVSVWIKGWVGELPRENVRVVIGGTSLPATFTSMPDAEGRIQINADLDATYTPCETRLLVEGPFGRSAAVDLVIQ